MLHRLFRMLATSACIALPLSVSADPAPGSPVAPTVLGIVRDSAGMPLPNVQVIVAEAGRTTTTDAEGKFTIRGLAPGSYHVTTLLVGYRPGHVLLTVEESGPDITLAITMTTSPLRLQAVSVTASPTGIDPARVAQATVEVSGLSLQRTLASNIAQTLGQEPGISVRFNGPATMPVIRGLTGDRILVLQDGARTADLSAAASDHASTVDPLSASRIEVVRGPASLLYGNNALGGVVNVISNDIPSAVPDHLEGYVGVIGESGTPGASTSVGATTRLGDSWALGVRGGAHSAGLMKVGGGATLANTQSRNWNGTIGLGYVGLGATAGVALSNYDFNYGLPHSEDDDEAANIIGQRTSATFRATINTARKAVPFFKLDIAAQDYSHDEMHDGDVGTSFHLKTQTFNGSAKTQFGRLRGSVGAQVLAKQYEARGDEALTPPANSNGVGAFVYQEVALSSDPTAESVPTISFGGRYDTYSITSKNGGARFGPGRTVDVGSPSGSLGVSVPIGGAATLSGNAALAFRAPTVEELFSNAEHHATASFERGNPNLTAEQSRGFEAVLRVGSGNVSLSASAYVNNIDNYVFPNVTRDTVVQGERMPLAVYEQTDARISGFEGSAEVHATQRIIVGAMADYVKGSFRDGGGPLPFMPPARIGGSLRWNDGKWNIGGDVRHGLAQDRTTGGADVATDAYTVVNLSAGVSIIARGRVHTVTARVDNLADTKYHDATSRIKEFAPNPGRNLAIVYKVLF